MPINIVLPGHLIDANTVKLDEPAPPTATGSEVEVRLQSVPQPRAQKLSQILRDLPPGTRSDADIQEQIREERDAWGE